MAENGNGKFGGREVVIVDAARTPIGRGHPEKGYYKDLHPSNLLAKVYSELFERSGVDPAETGDVSPVASSSSASRDSTSAAMPGSRPAFRSRPRRRRSTASAAPPSRRSTSPRRRSAQGSRLRDRFRRRAHGPHLLRRRLRGDEGARQPVLRGAAGEVRQPDSPGPLGGDDRRQVGDPPLRARRARPTLPAARRQGDRRGPLRARDHSLRRQRRHPHDRPGPARDDPRGPRRPQTGVQGGRQDHRRQLLPGLRRRRRRAADGAREGRRPRPRAAGADLRPDHGRRRPGDHAHRPDPGRARHGSCSMRGDAQGGGRGQAAADPRQALEQASRAAPLSGPADRGGRLFYLVGAVRAMLAGEEAAA